MFDGTGEYDPGESREDSFIPAVENSTSVAFDDKAMCLPPNLQKEYRIDRSTDQSQYVLTAGLPSLTSEYEESLSKNSTRNISNEKNSSRTNSQNQKSMPSSSDPHNNHDVYHSPPISQTDGQISSNELQQLLEKKGTQNENVVTVNTAAENQKSIYITASSEQKLLSHALRVEDCLSKKKMTLETVLAPKIPNGSSSKKKDKYNRYKKMLSMGVPLEAVSHKMLKDGLEDNSVKIFKKEHVNGEIKDDTIATSQNLDRAKEKDNTMIEKLSDLSSTYKKMLNVGVPIDSIVHKMKSDCVEKEKNASFQKAHEFSKSQGNDLDSLKVSPPIHNHRNHDQKETLETNHDLNINSPTNTDKTRALVGNDASLSKYKKMIAMGVPSQAVANKMRQDGVEKKKISAFEVANGLAYATPPAPIPITPICHMDKGCASQTELARRSIENDASLSKYKKMIAMGVPAQAVANKMKQDGVVKTKIAAFEVVNHITKSHSHIPAPKLSLPMPPTQTPTRRTSVAMQKIHWKPVSQERVGNSLWASAIDSESAIDDSEVRELENLFGARRPVGRKVGRVSSQTPKNKKISLIDSKRSYNITISLAQFKAFKSFDDLCDTVISLDSSRLNNEQLQNMMALMPTQDEMRKMKDYKGDRQGLGQAEMFFLSISTTPRFATKLNTFIFIQQFADNASELLSTVENLRSACEDIVSNQKLADILKRLLAIGNLVNEGAGKPKAAGITMDSLLKTANKIGTDGKTRVIDVVVSSFMKQDETGESIAFWSEMKTVNGAARTNIQDCRNSLREMQNGIKKVEFIIDSEEKVEDATTNNAILSALFVERCKTFLDVSMKICKDAEAKVEEAQHSFETLCMFFAEDANTCKATEVFGVILNFSRIAKTSKETWVRKARSAKRRLTMSNTPIKTSRSITTKDKPQSPQPCCPDNKSKEGTLPKFENNDREAMLISLRRSMLPRKRLDLQASDDHDAWE